MTFADLGPSERSFALRAMAIRGVTQAEAARRLGATRHQISNHVRAAGIEWPVKWERREALR